MPHDNKGNYVSNDSFACRVANGDIPGYTVVHKFGHNEAVGSSYVPVVYGGAWQTPQTAVALRIKAGGNAADTAAGNGAREVTLYGCDETGADASEALTTAGASASAYTTQTFIRLTKIVVTASGTYATQSAGSHTAAVTIEDSSANQWGVLPLNNSFPLSRSLIAANVIPLGVTGVMTAVSIDVDSTKSVNVVLFKREGILKSAAPYEAMQVLQQWPGVTGHLDAAIDPNMGNFPALTDVGFMAYVASSTAPVSVRYSMIMREV